MMFGTNKGAKLVARRLPADGVGVEIGVWRGKTSALFLQKAKFLHLVDPWSCGPYRNATGGLQTFLQRYAPMVGQPSEGEFQRFYDGIADEVRRKFADKPVKIWRCTSREFFRQFSDPVDWCYVDGSHEYADVLADLNGAAGIVKRGGVICGDDYDAKPGVAPAVDEFVKAAGLRCELLGAGQFWIYIPRR